MPVFDQYYPTIPYQSVNAGVIPPDVYGIAINWFVNRTPLFSRLPHLPMGAMSFLLTNDNYRPRSTTVNNGGATGTGTSFVVADGSLFAPGDVIEIENEQILVNSISTNTLTVTRAWAGTTSVTHADLLPIYIIGNTRTGGEVDVQALSRIPQTVEQYSQTVQFAYQVGGALASSTNYVSGFSGPLDRDRNIAMQNVVDDFETSCVYGKGQKLDGTHKDTTTGRQLQKGLRTLIATNNTTSPTNAGAYKPSDLTRDTIQKCFDGGGRPSLMIVSTDFLSGLSVWGTGIQRLNAGANAYGTPIEMFMTPFVPNVPFIPGPMLRPGTAICLSGEEVRLRIKRPLFDKPRGSRGDADEGDMIMEGAIELDNEAHHAWVSGISAFAPA